MNTTTDAKMKHTKEPWDYMLSGERFVITNEQGNIAFTARLDSFIDGTQIGNAHRIVACVNALASVADPEAALKACRDLAKAIAGREWEDAADWKDAHARITTQARRALALLGDL
jgi:hypothetical protein